MAIGILFAKASIGTIFNHHHHWLILLMLAKCSPRNSICLYLIFFSVGQTEEKHAWEKNMPRTKFVKRDKRNFYFFIFLFELN